MNYTVKRIAAAALVTLVSVPAMAATVSFDFLNNDRGHNGRYDGDLSVTVDDLTVDITAGRYAAPGGPGNDWILDTDCSDGGCGRFGDRYIRQTHRGLGVDGLFDSSSIDGAIGNDLITFAFNSIVDFTSVLFTGVDWNDDFDVFIDGVLVREEINIAANNPFSLASLGPISGQSISFGADGWHDNFRIGAVTVDVAAVPLPAGGLLLLSGLFGLVVMRRKQAGATA